MVASFYALDTPSGIMLLKIPVYKTETSWWVRTQDCSTL